MSTLAILLAIAAAATWALGMTISKPGVRHLDLLTFMLIRWPVVLLLAVIYAFVGREFTFPGWQPVAWAAVAGLGDAVAGGFLYLMAMQRTAAHQTTTLSSTAPLFGVLASVTFLREPLIWSAIVAAFLVVVGAYFLVKQEKGVTRSSLLGSLFALLTGVLWGVMETVPSKLALEGGLSPVSMLLVFSTTAVVGILLLRPLLRQRIPRRVDRRGVLYAVISAAGGAFLGWILWLHSLQLAPASLISPVRGSTLLFAFFYSVLFLRERPTARAFFGATLVFGGVLLVSVAS